MKLMFHARGFSVTPAIRDHLELRFSRTLRKWESRLNAVEVHMHDINGRQKGGEDKSVLVRIDLPGHPQLVVEAVSHDLYAAINMAARRAGRLVKRTIRRHDRIAHFGLRQLAYGPIEP